MPPTPLPTRSTGTPATHLDSSAHRSQIQTAKRTLRFYPISISPEESSTEILLHKAFCNFLYKELAMASSEITEITRGITLNYDHETSKLTAEFSSYRSSKLIFKYVKNLTPGLKISPLIPPSLAELHCRLKSQAYYLRHCETPCKTVIKYHHDNLALFVKPNNSTIWKPAPYPTCSQPQLEDNTPLPPLHVQPGGGCEEKPKN